jgi:phloretin hydrolase
MPRVQVSNADKQKSYYKYFLQPMVPGPQELYDRIKEGPLDNLTANRIHDRNELFQPGCMPGEFGYWMLEDGTAMIANRTFFPGTTGKMFDWWFAWHPIDRLRYAIWDHDEHYDVYLNDPARALDMSLSMRERHWDSVHNIWEDIGLGQIDFLRIHFRRPGDMGYDESKIDIERCNALVCANCYVVGSSEIPDAPIVMTHFLRPVAGGSELRSRFWFGWQIMDRRPVKVIPDGTVIPEFVPVALLNHNVKEFTNLAAILPKVYAEEKENWAK